MGNRCACLVRCDCHCQYSIPPPQIYANNMADDRADVKEEEKSDDKADVKVNNRADDRVNDRADDRIDEEGC